MISSRPSSLTHANTALNPQTDTVLPAAQHLNRATHQVQRRRLHLLLVSISVLGGLGIVASLTAGWLLNIWKSAEEHLLTQSTQQIVSVLKAQPELPKPLTEQPTPTLVTVLPDQPVYLYRDDQVPVSLQPTFDRLRQADPGEVEISSLTSDAIATYTLLHHPAQLLLLEVQHPEFRVIQDLQKIRLFNLLLSITSIGVATSSYWVLNRLVKLLTQQAQATELLQQDQEFALTTLQSIQEAVITTDAEGQIKMINPVAEKLTGWDSATAIGLPLQQVFAVEDHVASSVDLPIQEVLADGVALSGNQGAHSLIGRDGQRTSIDYTVTRIRDEDNDVHGVVVVFRDVTTHRNMARLLAWQANFDALTGLVNRREFERRLEVALQQATAHNAEHSLCFIDLDHFKSVNDNAGHPAGDELLRQISSLIRKYVRRSDLVARLGGDEFGVILYHCSLDEAKVIAKEVCRRINEYRFVWQEQTFTIGASIGLVMITPDSSESNQLFNLVDAACYAAKNQGRGRVCIYQPSMEDIKNQRVESQWIQRLNHALIENQFCIYSQVISPLNPQANLKGEYYEVLLRMFDDKGNIIPPNTFLPAAERYNLGTAIDRWVITNLFSAQASYYQERWQRWQSEGIPSLYCINLSAASISDAEFTKFVLDQIRHYSIPPQLLCFEIKETVAVANLSRVHQFVDAIKSIGCRFALDDFGSGMSSFAYLRNLPIDYLKIDGSLIRDIDNPSTFAMIESITRISNVMEMKTIAEFVTSLGIAKRCAAAGINFGQGYGLGRPRLLVGTNNIQLSANETTTLTG